MVGTFESTLDRLGVLLDPEESEAPLQLPLAELPFMDLLLRADSNDPMTVLYKPPGQSLGQTRLEIVPEEFDLEVQSIRARLMTTEKPAGAFRHGGMFFRYQKMLSSDDAVWVNVRRFNAVTVKLDNLNMAPEAVADLKTWNRATGLMLVGGATSNGKTTTLAHLFKHYIGSTGGVGITIEDPPEYPLHGPHGENGYCLQTEVRNGKWAESIEVSLRMSPTYIMLGEIRSPAAALQALQVAATGHFVMATIHAGSVDEAVGRFANLCSSAFDSGGDDYVRQELGRAIVGVAHQRLSSYGPDLSLLHPDNEMDRKSVCRIIEARQDGALTSGGWTKTYRAPRRGAEVKDPLS